MLRNTDRFTCKCLTQPTLYGRMLHFFNCLSHWVRESSTIEIAATVTDRPRSSRSLLEQPATPLSEPITTPDSRLALQAANHTTARYDSAQPDNRAILPVSASSQMVTFLFSNGCVLTLRTSGTEPKIKYYSEMCAKPEQLDWAALEAELADLVECVVQEMMEPQKNNLIPRAD
ncbi:phosphoglucomutase [Penaeus vannamei]|uniref:Phosphoglucomutase n=1 Tax=Penaeus vannamei TaxID=6689 RepID=A0A3R7PG11_PENVA|nr:phosphoglucomutase [Penaeus vannamei]